MEKEIVGYELINIEYKEVAKEITLLSWPTDDILKTNGYFNSIERLKRAGVLDLWFEPVYKEEEFKVGDWIIELWDETPYMGRTFQITSIQKDVYYYNRPNEGKTTAKHLRKATKEEIEDSLIEEAKKKGFITGVKFIAVRDTIRGEYKMINGTDCDFYSKEKGKIGDLFNYVLKTDTLYNYGSGRFVVYEKGKWARLLSVTPDITINSYKGEFSDWGVRFGCAKIAKKTFVELYRIIKMFEKDDCLVHDNSNRVLESVTIGKGTFTKNQIKEIAEYYLNK